MILLNTSQSAFFKGIVIALLSVALVGCTSNGASDNASANSNATNTVQPASAASFGDAATTWTKIGAAKADLDQIIATKKLAAVHEAAFKVRDIVRLLPAQSSALAPDKAKTLATQVENVDQLASKLDEAGDSGNLKATLENQAGLGDTLDTIHDLYPRGTFK